MASESTAPPPGSGNAKYAIIGVALLAGAVAVWFGMQSCEEPPPTPVAEAPDAGPGIDRTPDVVDDLVLPDNEPDAGGVDAGPRRVRYVTRYVGGGGGNWSCSGNMDRAAAGRALAQNRLQFRNCYERRLKVNNTLEGNVSLQVRVGRGGSVTGVQTGGSLRDAQVLSCIRGIAQRIRFPAPTGGCAVAATTIRLTPQR